MVDEEKHGGGTHHIDWLLIRCMKYKSKTFVRYESKQQLLQPGCDNYTEIQGVFSLEKTEIRVEAVWMCRIGQTTKARITKDVRYQE